MAFTWNSGSRQMESRSWCENSDTGYLSTDPHTARYSPGNTLITGGAG